MCSDTRLLIRLIELVVAVDVEIGSVVKAGVAVVTSVVIPPVELGAT